VGLFWRGSVSRLGTPSASTSAGHSTRAEYRLTGGERGPLPADRLRLSLPYDLRGRGDESKYELRQVDGEDSGGDGRGVSRENDVAKAGDAASDYQAVEQHGAARPMTAPLYTANRHERRRQAVNVERRQIALSEIRR
jgi:hypothetical protein